MMFFDETRTIFCVAAGCLLASWLQDRIKEMRKSADEWEAGLRAKGFKEGYESGYREAERTAEWNREHPDNEHVPTKDPATA
jgi:hypothetical protein